MTDSHSAAGIQEGMVLAGKFRIEKILGVGGMGVVVAAHHLQLDERVALKFLLPETLDNAEAVARFAREARAAVKIKSEHVARVTDVGTLESGAPYMVMEYLEGGDLAGWLKERGTLPVEQAVEFVLQASEAIAEAHSIGIVHRDLKPANLFVVRRPDGQLSVKVLDFGISKVTGFGSSGADPSITKTSAVMGSPLYMSPEQMQSSKDVDSRSDIWALGVILYELLSGVSPFAADTMPELVLKVVTTPPPPLRGHRSELPQGLEPIVLRCLEKDRARRYESVGELAVALYPFAPRRSRTSVDRISGVLRNAGLSASALALPPSSDPKDAGSGTQASWGATHAKVGAGTGIAALVVLALVAGAAGMFYLSRARAGAASAASAQPPASAPSAALATALLSTSASTGAEVSPPASGVEAPLPVALAGASPGVPPRPVGAHAKPGPSPSPRSTAPAPASAPAAQSVPPPSPPPAKKASAFDDRK